MNVLILEDRGSVAENLKNSLELEGCKVFNAPNVWAATEIWDENRIDCIILDLNMSPEGMTEEQIEETELGLLTGWIWLRDHVLKSHPDMKERTIIYSEYTHFLEDLKRADKMLQKITAIAKREEDGARKLLARVNEISTQPPR